MPRRNNTPKHTPFTKPKTCQTKRRFSSEADALDAADQQMLIKPTLELNVYKCEFCSGWHLTRSLK